jgi:uncharacterized membrane protein
MLGTFSNYNGRFWARIGMCAVLVASWFDWIGAWLLLVLKRFPVV